MHPCMMQMNSFACILQWQIHTCFSCPSHCAISSFRSPHVSNPAGRPTPELSDPGEPNTLTGLFSSGNALELCLGGLSWAALSLYADAVSHRFLRGDWWGREARGSFDGDMWGDRLGLGEAARDRALRADGRGEELAEEVGALAGTCRAPALSAASAWPVISSMVGRVGMRLLGLQLALLHDLSGLAMLPKAEL